MQQTGAALGVAALTSVAASHGRAAALLTGAGIAVAALVVAGLFIRPVRPIRATVPSTMEGADDRLAPLAHSE